SELCCHEGTVGMGAILRSWAWATPPRIARSESRHSPLVDVVVVVVVAMVLDGDAMFPMFPSAGDGRRRLRARWRRDGGARNRSRMDHRVGRVVREERSGKKCPGREMFGVLFRAALASQARSSSRTCF